MTAEQEGKTRPEEQWSVAVIDIETVADLKSPGLVKQKERVQAPSTWKDITKIEANKEMQRRKLDDKAALNPLTGRIICIGLALRAHSSPDQPWDIAAFTAEKVSEAELLRKIDDVLYSYKVTTHVTFAGRGFDFPYLAIRSMTHELDLRCKWPMGYDKRHVDLFDIFGKDGSLDVISSSILGESKHEGGEEIATLHKLGNWSGIVSHCEDCVAKTARLYDLVNRVTLPGKRR